MQPQHSATSGTHPPLLYPGLPYIQAGLRLASAHTGDDLSQCWVQGTNLLVENTRGIVSAHALMATATLTRKVLMTWGLPNACMPQYLSHTELTNRLIDSMHSMQSNSPKGTLGAATVLRRIIATLN